MKQTPIIMAALTTMLVTFGGYPPGYAQTGSGNRQMVLIPSGEFTMGSLDHADEPPHQVVLDAYKIDKFEVSNKQYGEFMKAKNHPAPAYWDDPRLNKPEQPVVGVNWYDAKAYCESNGLRLPTEAEWEHVAKGPKGDYHYPWGHSFDAKKVNYGQRIGKTSPVDAHPEGASGFGVYNMAGNVFEWVSDWYAPDYYKKSPALNPTGPDIGLDFAKQGPVRALRGGSWLAPETSLHTSHRFWNQPDNNSYGVGLGFRCAVSEGPRTASDKVSAPTNAGSAVNPKAVVNSKAVVNPKVEAREAYMEALIAMGAEKQAEATALIDKAIKLDPKVREYKDLRELIKKNTDKKK